MPIIDAQEEKGKYQWTWKEFIGDVVEDNRQAQKTVEPIKEGAMGRKIASIPFSVYRSWQKEFETVGGKNQDNWNADWKVFLWRKIESHPQFRTVAKLKTETAHAGNIFIR